MNDKKPKTPPFTPISPEEYKFTPISIESLRDGSALPRIAKFIDIEKACRYFIDETVNKRSINPKSRGGDAEEGE
mgnify:FL=1